MLQRERGKEKALRIDLNYYRRRTWLGTFRGVAAAAGLFLAVLYGAWVLSSEARETPASAVSRAIQLSTGPLSQVHTHFENDCQSCHAAGFGAALAHDAWQPASEQRLELQETKCQTCHRADAHARDMLVRPELDRDCVRCHREHLGSTYSLVKVNNSICADCHANLNAACRPGAHPLLSPAVADFSVHSHRIATAASEPPLPTSNGSSAAKGSFRSLLNDRGRVRFDHAQHLRAGQVDPGSKGGFQLDMLLPRLRPVYARPGQSESDLVQLDCSSCHQPYAIHEPGHAAAVAREEARLYAPIRFEDHCAACHQISFAGQTPQELPLPHVAQREEYARLLAAKQFAGSVPAKFAAPGEEALEPAKVQRLDASGKSLEREQEKIDAAVDAVFVRCQQCHLAEDTRPEVISQALAGTLEPLVPRRWLEHGSFSHAAHARITRCAYCHEMPTAAGEPDDNHKVFIKGPESCTPCHRAAGAAAPPEFATEELRIETLGQKDQPTWASDDCTTCHRYHWSRSTSSPKAATPLSSTKGLSWSDRAAAERVAGFP